MYTKQTNKEKQTDRKVHIGRKINEQVNSTINKSTQTDIQKGAHEQKSKQVNPTINKSKQTQSHTNVDIGRNLKGTTNKDIGNRDKISLSNPPSSVLKHQRK